MSYRRYVVRTYKTPIAVNDRGYFNLLGPTGYVMYQQVFVFYILPHCIFVICVYLRTNSEVCSVQHNRSVFITEMQTVYCAVRTGSLNKQPALRL
jgi:hypothetical protein